MTIRYNPKTNKIIPHRFTIEQLEEADENCEGYCLACGESKSGCEPDARKYECDECGKMQVYGAGEIALMGLVQ